ncbi:MAG TPA: BamA/TamA family outer membrane protein [Sphingomicrobium sp.]|nr:BamA/TamA family outer membrane protein [Sphingomicrobium sp.]
MDSRQLGRGIAVAMAAAGAGLALGPPAFAQEPMPSSSELDPSAPLDPIPDLGVAWPDLQAEEPAILPPETTDHSAAPPAASGQIDDSAAARRYVVALNGVDQAVDADLLKAFRQQSALEGGIKKPANAAQIDRRARADSDLLAELLRAEGFYDARVEPRIEVSGAEDQNSVAAVTVFLDAVPGEQYKFTSVELPGLEGAGADESELREKFAIKTGDPVVAKDVIAAGIALKVALGQRGFATARIGDQDILIDHEARTAQLVLPVEPGPVARFGEIRVTGQPPLGARHVERIARFKPGDRFKQSEVDDLRRALVATGLVSTVEVKVTPASSSQVVDLDVHLEPAPMRTIAGEVGYGTGEGLRAEASWQHRNFFNPEGALTVRGVVGTQEQLAAVSFRRNNFRQRDQVLNAQISASNVDRKAFAAKTLLLSGGIERQSNFIWHKKWTWSLGGELALSDERDTIESTGEARRRKFFIAAVPATLGYDGSDDLLDPTKGFRLLGRLSPEVSFQSGTLTYARAQFDASAYHPLSDRVVAAGRVRLGTIVGASRDQIAPSRRFYAGGGGSVRGYGYQQLGPRDADNDPIGGRSLAEFALETRIRVGGVFGIVPFFDGGTLSTSATPSMKDWQFGAGIGARYYSSFGPIRIDVGTPLNPQKGDGRVAVTVSLGQAF